jgi:hypothetical protein
MISPDDSNRHLQKRRMFLKGFTNLKLIDYIKYPWTCFSLTDWVRRISLTLCGPRRTSVRIRTQHITHTSSYRTAQRGSYLCMLTYISVCFCRDNVPEAIRNEKQCEKETDQQKRKKNEWLQASDGGWVGLITCKIIVLDLSIWKQ